ncbi:unnamed protein product [Umbelopsis ramanniana]
MSVNQALLQTLPYSIWDFSSHSASYHPRNIMENNPMDQSSRWSSGTNNQMQYITLKLDRPAIVHSVTFGKFHKVHVCNLKEFKVLGGASPNKMTELVHSGLRNDNEPETFALKHTANNVIFPIQYIKIVPLMAWGANFNFSIWFIELRGIMNPDIVSRAQIEYEQCQEMQTIRLCLKHFRERNMIDVFNALSRQTNVQLEDPLLTDLHQALVLDANYPEAERIITQASKSGLFESYLKECDYTPLWHCIDTDQHSPSVRGGHQMCIDVEGGLIYLLGGWNGKMDLSDFWCYNIRQRQWAMISSNTANEGGPGPRSCHKICFDPSTRSIYVLGRYVESQARMEANLNPDFYQYLTHINQWMKISDNTSNDGGPDLIYDHQMCMDTEKQMLYVFGGRTVHPDTNQHNYSGLYRYNANMNSWKLLRSDVSSHSPPTPPHENNNGSEAGTISPGTSTLSPTVSSPSIPSPLLTQHGMRSVHDQPATLKSRVGHSMLYDPVSRLLYIFAGQRLKDYLSDFYAYSLDRDEVIEISRDYSRQAGPDAGFTQRATMDAEKQEIYILSGYMKVKGHDTVKNSFWVYDIRTNVWKKVYQNEAVNDENQRIVNETEPCPRYAHQLVYDHINKVQYLFGGNPGDKKDITKRLDDFWELRLHRPDSQDILRKCLFQIRAQHFMELCEADGDAGNNGLPALQYLQNELSQVVDHKNPKESTEFRQLSTNLVMGMANGKSKTDFANARNRLYEHLLSYFPKHMKQPDESLIDTMRIV